MAASVPEMEPATLVAGDTWSWLKTLADYSPTDGWSLSYALRFENGAGLLNITAASSSTQFSITVPAASTTTMKAGLWHWASYVTKTTERYQYQTGTITVMPNLAAIDFSTDLRSPAKLAYDNAMQAWQSVKLGQTVSLNGRVYTQHDLDKLTRYVQVCRSEYVAELNAQQDEITGGKSRRIGIQLNRV